MSVNSNSEAMTTEDLRNKLFNKLRNKGFVGKLQSQLRNHLVVEMRGVGLSQALSAGRDNFVGGESLPLRAVNSLVADHLKQAGYDYSLSIFLPESGTTEDKMLTTKDLLQLLRVSSQSKLYKTLNDASASNSGFLWRLVKEIAVFNSRPVLETGTQTEVSRMPCTSIEEEFRKVDAYYSSLDEGGASRVAAVEERILAYQRLVEERSRSELQMSIARFKENELARLRIEERESSRKEIEKSRREMEQSYQTKYDGLRDRERNFSESTQKHQEMIEKENFAQRQKILEEIDSVKQREAQLRRQQEINNRERSLAEERLKSLEETARRREDSARRAELEIEQRIRNEVEKFKVEEQARYLERLKNLEFREDKVKDNEKRVDDELQEMTHVKVELREKRGKVTETEAELIRVKHDLIAAQKQNEMFRERAREMADYQNMREDNAVLRKELDNAKGRIAELTRDVMVERQKHEDILRELGHVASKPTPEVGLLRKQIEQLHLTLRTERSLADHAKYQMDQRLENEMDRNKQLLTKYQEQSWRQKEVNWETRDLREQVLGRDRALHMRSGGDELSRSESPCDLIDGRSKAPLPKLGDPSLYQHVIDPHLLFDSPLNTARISADPCTPTRSDDCSFSSDLIRDTRNRLKRIDLETEKLEKWYQDCQMHAINIAPSLGPESATARSRDATPKTKTSLSKQVPDLARYPEHSGSVNVGPDNFGHDPSSSFDHKRSAESSERKPSTAKNVSTPFPVGESATRGKALVQGSEFREPEKKSVSDHSRSFGFEQPPERRERVDDGDFWDESKSEKSKMTGEAKSSPAGGSPGFYRISSDNDQRPAQISAKVQQEDEDRRRQEAERFDRERRQRLEERQRREEETWKKEQAELEKLQAQDRGRGGSADEKQMEVEKTVEIKNEQEKPGEVGEASQVSEVDPEMLKYMAIVQKKREEEKQMKAKEKAPIVPKNNDTEDESVATTDEVSAPDDKNDVQSSPDDDW